MQKKEIVAMLLAGGQGSRLGILTKTKAKPAVAFGGKYKIIDFPMSNSINSGIDTVGVLTQYEPLALNRHIGIGIPWDLDRKNGGVTLLAPHVKGEHGEWYTGTANAIYQNIDYIDSHSPKYILILSGDHIYNMNYAEMLKFHKKNNCDATIAVFEVPIEEANRFGIMNAYENGQIYEFEEKPKNPKSNLASMGIYIFSWDKLRKALVADNDIHEDSDFGKHIIPMMLEEKQRLFAYKFEGYWKDVGTIESYWAANMDLIVEFPPINLYEEFSKIYTNVDHQPPIYTASTSAVNRSILAEGCEIYGEVYNSVLGMGVVVEEGAIVRDSIIMSDCFIGKSAVIERAVIDSEAKIGNNVIIGTGENIPNEEKPKIYDTGITVIGEFSVVPDNVVIGKNCVIYGKTKPEDYTDGVLSSGKTIITETEEVLA
ncbi:MAG: glucose-1-phosphate adenylyltransferase [Clostridiales bacterium]|nr:glucose-1-phosphate adenylyltransferase [Clostridiales bacterium]